MHLDSDMAVIHDWIDANNEFISGKHSPPRIISEYALHLPLKNAHPMWPIRIPINILPMRLLLRLESSESHGVLTASWCPLSARSSRPWGNGKLEPNATALAVNRAVMNARWTMASYIDTLKLTGITVPGNTGPYLYSQCQTYCPLAEFCWLNSAVSILVAYRYP